MVDIDGVLTDGGLYYSDNGVESKKFNSKDGLAMMRLKEKGIKVGILSSGFKSTIAELRAATLTADYVFAGRENKIDILKNWCSELNIGLNQVAYIGDDLNDLEVIEAVGVSACPADAVKQVKEAVHVILTHKGGEGCVREFIDEYLL